MIEIYDRIDRVVLICCNWFNINSKFFLRCGRRIVIKKFDGIGVSAPAIINFWHFKPNRNIFSVRSSENNNIFALSKRGCIKLYRILTYNTISYFSAAYIFIIAVIVQNRAIDLNTSTCNASKIWISIFKYRFHHSTCTAFSWNILKFDDNSCIVCQIYQTAISIISWYKSWLCSTLHHQNTK